MRKMRKILGWLLISSPAMVLTGLMCYIGPLMVAAITWGITLFIGGVVYLGFRLIRN